MIVEHTLLIGARCPVNGLRDVYEVAFRLNRFVQVEELLEATAGYVDQAIYQEELTQQLANLFRCQVESRGRHSGVRTRVRCLYESDGERQAEASENPAGTRI